MQYPHARPEVIGAMIDGHTNGPYLNHPSLHLFWERADGADVPLGSTQEAAHFIDSVPIAQDPRADSCVNNANTYLGL